jgi:hypothetical protein
MDPQSLEYLLSVFAQNGQQQQGQDGGESPYGKGAIAFIQSLAEYLQGEQGRKEERWNFGQRKDLYDNLRWGELNKPAVGKTDLSAIMAKIQQSMQPGFSDMSWGASRAAGMGSPQTYRMYAKERLPVEAGATADLDKWAIMMNENKKMSLAQILANLTRG